MVSTDGARAEPAKVAQLATFINNSDILHNTRFTTIVRRTRHQSQRNADQSWREPRAREGRVAPACSLLGFRNLRARAETASSGPLGTRKAPNATAASRADTCEKCL